MSRRAPGIVLMAVSVLLAILAMLIPMPLALEPLRPYCLALVVAYWVLESPERAGLGFAFFCGLLADLAYGSVLGEQALRMVILAFILDRFRNRLRVFPVWQQGLLMGGLLLNDRIVAFVLHWLAGVPQWPWHYWLSPISGALLWGPIFLVLDMLRHRRRR